MDIAIYLGLCLVILIMLIYIRAKDKQNNKRIERFETALNEAISESFIARKNIFEIKKNMDEIVELKDVFELNKLYELRDEMVKLKTELKELKIPADLNKKIDNVIETKVKDMLSSLSELIRENMVKANEGELIIRAYKSGKTPQEISTRYKIELDRVESVLNQNSLI